ncbi:MAG TPA: hypothetical protein DCS45_04535 [Roseovarius nubinhibens]|uniref:Uncharacterized protein n=1 Tax=Roseovarius nubinhibens TaxID=314263 RepID=A0A348W9C1_9RHOB|nr:hypothetical protein [Roseovarius nubinhibens]
MLRQEQDWPSSFVRNRVNQSKSLTNSDGFAKNFKHQKLSSEEIARFMAIGFPTPTIRHQSSSWCIEARMRE